MIAKSHYRIIPGCCWTNRIACDYDSSLKTFFLAFKRLANGLGRAHYLFRCWLEPVKGWADEIRCPWLICGFILIPSDLPNQIGTMTSLGVDQLPVAMGGPESLVCFLIRTAPGGSKL